MAEGAKPGSLGAFARTLVAYDRRGLAMALLLMFLVALGEGIGLLLLIPLLGLIDAGASSQTGKPDGLAAVLQGLGFAPSLESILLIYLLLMAIRSFLVYRREIYLTDLRLRFVDHLRVELNAALGQADWRFLSQRRGSDLIHVLTADINRVGHGTYAALQLMVGVVLALVQVVLALALAPGVTLLTLAVGCALLLLFLPQLRRARSLGQTLTVANAQVFGDVSEFLAGIKLAKSYTAEARHRDTFAASVASLRQQVLDFTHHNSLLRAGYQLGAAVALCVVLYLAVTLTHTQGPTLLVLVLIFARLLPLLSGSQQQYQQLLHALPAFASAMALQGDAERHAEAPTQDGFPPLIQGIQLSELSFRYQDSAALDSVDLQIPARATTALVGPSGAGKSTLADLLGGLLYPSGGEIRIDDQPLTPALTRAWRQQVAYVPQEVFLFNDTVAANLRWAAPQASDNELWQAMGLTAIDQVVRELPQGLDTILGDRGIRLSGGERQRLALARALLRRPSLLILDEATSALDSENERRIQQAMDGLHGELTILVIAHRLSTVRNADQLVVLERGRIVEQGDWATLAGRDQGRLRAMLDA